MAANEASEETPAKTDNALEWSRKKSRRRLCMTYGDGVNITQVGGPFPHMILHIPASCSSR
jgi:hypothetical protein